MIDRSIPIARFVQPELKNNRSQTSIYVSNFACAVLQIFPVYAAVTFTIHEYQSYL